jgi:RNA polymerase sigma-70 factor (ECF subfamily)
MPRGDVNVFNCNCAPPGAVNNPPRLTTDLDRLLRRVAQRDAAAFAEFYDATKARVFGLVTRVLRDPGYSEETTQEIFAQVWRAAASFDPQQGSALTWVMTLAHRRAVDRVRAEQAASRRDSKYGAANIETPTDVVADSAIERDERRRVAECLGGLSELQRQCIEMAYYDGLTYAQVSQRLSTSLGTIKSRMRDGLRNLRECLGVP